MGTSALRRLGGGLAALAVLTCAGVAQPVLATAAPTPAPSTGTGTAGPASPAPTPATSTRYATSGTPFSVTVSPARLAVTQDAVGRTHPVTVVNRGQEAVSLTVDKRDFVARPDGGLSYEPDAPFGASRWMRVSPTRLDLEPGASEQVDVTFEVPDSPEPGDHQVALVFLAPAVKTDGNIQVNRGIGAPVYVTVPGPVDDSVRLDGLTGPRWSLRGDPTLTATLRSTGTVHRDFRGPTALAVGTPDHAGRFPDFTVSRGADRVVSTTWDAPLLCVCRPSMTLTNADGVAQTVSTRVVVLPWWVLVGLLAVVLAVMGVVLRRRSLRARSTGAAETAPDDLDPLPAGHG